MTQMLPTHLWCKQVSSSLTLFSNETKLGTDLNQISDWPAETLNNDGKLIWFVALRSFFAHEGWLDRITTV